MISVELKIRGAWADHPAVKLAERELISELPQLFGLGVCVNVVLEMGRPLKDWKFAPDRIAWRSDGRGSVRISGNHPRAVLFAAYAWLESLGVRWLYPGAAGKRLPAPSSAPPKRSAFRSTAAFPTRGVATEGAFQGPELFEFIEWMARQRLNHLFLQFESSRIFYHRALGAVSENLVRRWDDDAVGAAVERGLILEKVGHDWLNKTFGFGVTDFHDKRKATAAQRRILAQVHGRRDFVNGKPMFSQVCLSAPGVRSRLKKYFLSYCRRHPEIDVIAFWLGDGLNNWCECDRCRRQAPSDQYVALVNELAEALHRACPAMKLEAICYTNFLTPPRLTRLRNKHKNVIFAFAPYARNLLRPLRSGRATWTPPALNRVRFPCNGGYWKSFLDWRRRVDTPRIYFFDYYFGEQWLNESFLSEVMRRDLLCYRKLGLGGVVSCQPIHQFFPHGANMAAMAKLLWNPKQSLRPIWRDYFTSHFGEPGGSCLMEVWLKQSKLLQRQNGKGRLDALKKKALRRCRAQHELLWKALRNDGDALATSHHRAWMKYSDYWGGVLKELGDTRNAAQKGRQICEAIRKSLIGHEIPLPDRHKTARAAQVAIDGKL